MTILEGKTMNLRKLANPSSLHQNRSTSPNSLSIWTHHIRGLQNHDTFQPQGSASEYPNALTIAAGHQMRDIYAKVAQCGRIIVGGMDPNVGIGGYITGGGHSPISGHYGLAADQVLQMELVTPDGELVVANEATNVDLFWAMRGVSERFRAIQMLVNLDSLIPLSGRWRNLWRPPLRHSKDIPDAVDGPVNPSTQPICSLIIRILVGGGSSTHKAS